MFRFIPLISARVKRQREPPVPRLLGLLYATTAVALGVGLGFNGVPRLTSETTEILVVLTATNFVLLQFSVSARAIHPLARGYISFAPLPQVAALILLGPLWGALSSASAMTIWCLSNTKGRSITEASFRALANGGMFFIAALLAGLAYERLHGFAANQWADSGQFIRVLILIVILQGINEVLFLGLIWPQLSREARRHPFHWSTLLSEATIALMGLLAAMLAAISYTGFGIFIAFVIGAAWVFYRLGISTERERQHARELMAIDRVNQAANANLDLKSLLEIIHTEAQGMVQFAAMHIALYDADKQELEVLLNYDEGVRRPARRLPLGRGLLTWPVEHDEAIFVPDTSVADGHPALKRQLITGRAPLSLVVLPIRFHGQIVGVLSAQDYTPYAIRIEHKRLLENFANQIGSAIVNARLRDELEQHRRTLEDRVASRTAALERTTKSLERALREQERLLRLLDEESRHDPLTELPNRREIDAVLKREIYRATRFGHPLSVAMADLDHFKRINDTLGHAAGDRVLHAIAEAFRQHLRATDSAGRYGGEEFVLVFPETSPEEAATACDNMRQRIAQHPWEDIAPGLEIRISFGVVGLTAGHEDPQTLLASADRALYHAKSEGRNRVVKAPPLSDKLSPLSETPGAEGLL